MPFVTFTVRCGLSTADKFHFSAAMIEAQVAAGFHRDDLFHRFLEVDHGNLLADPRFPDYTTDRTDRFIVVEVNYFQREANRNRRNLRRGSGQTVRRAPTLGASGRPVYLPRSGTGFSALSR